MKSLKQILVGKPLRSTNDESHLLSKREALPMLSSDALSSIAYGTEQIVLVLMTAGAGAIWYSLPIAGVILILLAALIYSYTQVIHAYPSGGGAYLVSTENLGKIPGLISGGSLLVDYMLTVAVSTSSGADAITSTIPALHPFNMWIAIILTLLLMFMNLRGLRESASALMIPVYTFIASTFLLLIVGIVRILSGSLPYHATEHVGTTVTGISLIILLKAFSTGASSLTGVEAISNAVPFFKKPKERNASLTLIIMGVILAVFFGGITFINYWLGITPQSGLTVLSQVASATFGSGAGYILFLVFQFSTALILAVAANTGYSAFPILAYNMAKNKYMPHMYMERGDRLGYSNGIISLAVGSIILTIIFKGKTEALIPLYAIGVFTPFALAQTGMVIHWKKHLGSKFLTKSIPNIVGAFISYAIVGILLILRTSEIWPYFIVMPILIYAFLKVKRHYTEVATQLRIDSEISRVDFKGNTVIVLVGSVTKASIGALSYANSIGDDVVGVHISTKDTAVKDQETKEEFLSYFPDIKYSDVESGYRDIVKPVARYVQIAAQKAATKGHTVTIVIPQFVPNRRWQNILHNQMALRLRLMLSMKENIIVSSYSYHLKK